MRRLEAACGEDDIVFRIGGDEFVALTNSESREYAEKIASRVLSQNGEAFRYKDRDIPLYLHAVSYMIESKPLRYAKLFSEMQKRLDGAKRT